MVKNSHNPKVGEGKVHITVSMDEEVHQSAEDFRKFYRWSRSDFYNIIAREYLLKHKKGSAVEISPGSLKKG
jgi:hypothetical protein